MPALHLVFDEAPDLGDGPLMHDAAARRDDAEPVALQLEEAAQRGRGFEPSVDPVERVEQRAAAGALRVGARLVEERLRRPRDRLADEPFPRPEPAVHRRASEAELRRDRPDVDSPPVKVSGEGRVEDVLAARRRTPSASPIDRCRRFRHVFRVLIHETLRVIISLSNRDAEASFQAIAASAYPRYARG